MAIRPTVRTISASAWRSIRTAIILDRAFSVVERGGRQHCLYGSRRAPIEPPVCRSVPSGWRSSNRCVGPGSCSTTTRQALSCDLTFSARTGRYPGGAPDPLVERPSRHGILTWFDQFGRWRGVVRHPDGEITVDDQSCHGTKDCSWGFRNVGEREVGGAPMPPLSVSSSGPRCSGTTISHAIFFDGTRGEALVREGFDRAALPKRG